MTNKIKFIDRICGAGKTTAMISNLEVGKRYLIVTPALDDINAILDPEGFYAPLPVPLVQPEDTDGHTKMKSLLELVEDGENIITTHKLFDDVDIRKVNLGSYHLIIDEVFDCVKHHNGPSTESFDSLYLDKGLCTLDEDGRVIPTSAWTEDVEGALACKLLGQARSGRLYKADDGFYVTVVPVSLFTETKTTTVMTYKAEGSLMAMYLRRNQVPFDVDVSDNEERSIREHDKKRLEIIKLDLGTGALGHHRQGSLHPATQKKIAGRIKNERGRGALKGVDADSILVTCRKSLWESDNGKPTEFRKATKLGRASWCHKSTKGTNKYKDCTHAVHIYDLNMNPSIKKFLGATDEDEDNWRLSELVQWLYRTNLRDRRETKPVKLLCSSDNNIRLFQEWLKE